MILGSLKGRPSLELRDSSPAASLKKHTSINLWPQGNEFSQSRWEGLEADPFLVEIPDENTASLTLDFVPVRPQAENSANPCLDF